MPKNNSAFDVEESFECKARARVWAKVDEKKSRLYVVTGFEVKDTEGRPILAPSGHYAEPPPPFIVTGPLFTVSLDLLDSEEKIDDVARHRQGSHRRVDETTEAQGSRRHHDRQLPGHAQLLRAPLRGATPTQRLSAGRARNDVQRPTRPGAVRLNHQARPAGLQNSSSSTPSGRSISGRVRWRVSNSRRARSRGRRAA